MKKATAMLILPLLMTLLVACGKPDGSAALEQIRQDGELVVVTRNAPTSYFIDRNDQPAGFEHDLVSAFADMLGVPVRFEVRHSLADIMDTLEQGDAHLAAAGLTRLDSRAARFDFGPAYHQVQQQVVCRRGGKRPSDIDDLDSVSLMIISDSSYEDRLEEIRDNQLPTLKWQSDDSLTTELILQRVWERQVDCTVADSNIVAINRRFYPELVIAFPLTEPQDLVWLLPQGARELQQALNDWLNEFEDNGGLAMISTRYYAHVEIFDYVDISRYLRRIEERLPQYQPMFEQAGDAHGIDWTLLAAQAYQESHWNPSARSPTGVRGMMMLTLPTAGELGVENRLDAAQSIDGGARYLANLRRRLPDSVEEPDRTWLALAAYNVGMGHLYDARGLAEQLGYDKDTWAGMREVLPKLAKPEYYQQLRYGYARGSEPVHYLARIRNYRQILQRYLDTNEQD